MARPMRMKDKKNYMRRCRSSHTGNASGADTTEKSKYLAIKYDSEHGIPISEDKKRFMNEYEKCAMINKL